VQAGAVEYILQALAGPYRPQLVLYRRGLKALDQFARVEHSVPFAALSEAVQDTLLQALEAGTATSVPAGAEFFAMVREHVLEGVFCEPSYGGNHDLAGWRIVGFPGQRTGYPDAYINRVVDLPPVAAAASATREAQQ
jgi:gluconate 2-dehydrogenase gamma chain